MNVVQFPHKGTRGRDSLMVAFGGAIFTLWRYVKGKHVNDASADHAQEFFSDLLDEYIQGEWQRRERIFILFAEAINRIPYFAGKDKIHAARRLKYQWHRLKEFQGGAYDEQLLPKLFVEELQKLMDERDHI